MEIIKIVLFFSILGAISSGIGGFLTTIFKIKSNKFTASLFEITGGIMTGIVCFDMLPESFSIASIWYSIFGVIIGVIIVYFINYFVERNNNKINYKLKGKNSIVYSTTSVAVILSMGLHNAIEGLAIGSGFSYSYSLGLSLLISIFLHDIPEGMVVGITNKKDTDNVFNIIINTILVGSCVGIGCIIGLLVGKIDDKFIAFSLSIAAGAMLYIVSCDLIPYSKKLTNSKITSIMYILGIVIGAMFNRF